MPPVCSVERRRSRRFVRRKVSAASPRRATMSQARPTTSTWWSRCASTATPRPRPCRTTSVPCHPGTAAVLPGGDGSGPAIARHLLRAAGRRLLPLGVSAGPEWSRSSTSSSRVADPAGHAMTEDILPIAHRVWAEPEASARRRQATTRRRASRPSHHVLVFDTETTADHRQSLTFGVWRYCRVDDDGLTASMRGSFMPTTWPRLIPRHEILRQYVDGTKPATERDRPIRCCPGPSSWRRSSIRSPIGAEPGWWGSTCPSTCPGWPSGSPRRGGEPRGLLIHALQAEGGDRHRERSTVLGSSSSTGTPRDPSSRSPSPWSLTRST